MLPVLTKFGSGRVVGRGPDERISAPGASFGDGAEQCLERTGWRPRVWMIFVVVGGCCKECMKQVLVKFQAAISCGCGDTLVRWCGVLWGAVVCLFAKAARDGADLTVGM